MSENVSRREFVKMAGAAVGGLALGAVGGYSLLSPKETIIEKEVKVPQEVPELPWEYTKLNVERVKARAYESHYQGGCSYGVFEGVIGELRETVGHPFTVLPGKLAFFGRGGLVGWGATCGCLTGGGMAINTVTSESGPVNDLMGWYVETALPKYIPAVAVKLEGELHAAVSGSPLCHASITNWCKSAGVTVSSLENKERCGRLVADTAGKVAEMLNALLDGTFTAAYAVPASVVECGSCHGADGVIPTYPGKMDCIDCHGDPHTG